MKKGTILTIIIFFIINSLSLFGQEAPTVQEKTTRPLTKWERRFGEIRYGENIYRKGSNWLNFGLGYGYHINKEALNKNVSLTYYHRYKGMFFDAGIHYSSPKIVRLKPLGFEKTMERLIDTHAGAGLRLENRWLHFGFFIGPSFATTWTPESKVKSLIHYNLGAHIEAQLIYKYLYDLGVGLSFYGSFNKRYQVAGIQLTLYFSNAFVTKY
jgi:hypothetical protein